ncbi:MAG: PSD1 domain-containing protein [Verrucomicrobiales bacterium]|nr:PSD1 domain-containing protein [Verrucomicrobiales bacterium]
MGPKSSHRSAIPGWILLWIGTLVTAGSISAAEPARPATLAFNRDIRPILSDHCFACHGTDARKRKAGLRLDLAEGAYTTNKHGIPAIRPGSLSGSELWKRITTEDPEEVMPPPDTHKPLSAEQRDLLRRWIEQGAPYQRHWSFEPLATPPVPASVAGSATPDENPIDRFIRSRLSQEGLSPAPEADRSTLIRRLSFDLRGLPPTPAEVDAFLADTRPGAYRRLVDQFLASPAYGEEMARHWLDVARYGDTHGLHLDNERSMWPYRDWVVGAFNRNLPFDEFTIEQIAGDLLPSPTPDQLTATGFSRCNVTTGEGGAIDAEFLFRYAVDRTATVAETWLGLTAGCAVCHDHKFDPLSTREFYSLYAFFYSAADPAMDGNTLLTAPTVRLPKMEDTRRLADFDVEISSAEDRVREALAAVSYTDPATLTPPPPVREVETVWLDDDFPTGAKVTASGAPTRWTESGSGPVFSGRRALHRKDGGIAQDFYDSGAAPLEIPQGATIFAHVYVDPADPPKTIMLQYNKDGWEHRAIWGDPDAIGWGEKDKPSRARIGDLPKAGEWVRLEFPAERVGLKPGDKVTGLAFTQYGGTVSWDKAGVLGRIDPAHDPLYSLRVWQEQREGKSPDGLPDALKSIFKNTTPAQRSASDAQALRDYYLSNVCLSTRPTFEPLVSTVARLRRERSDFENAITATFVFRDLDKPRDAFVMMRGQYDKPGDKVVPAMPAALSAPQGRISGNSDSAPRLNRLDLARWLVSSDQPLTARVTVNRFWSQFFGTGIVRTTSDFGSQGEPPVHPELLDWLANTFRESGWDVKWLVREMVTSATYRQSSRVTRELVQRDPENRLLARGPRFRLGAEQIRDNALFAGGLMDSRLGGKGVKPYQPPNIWEPVGFVGSNTREYKQDTGSALYRRSLYTFFKRTAPAPFMTTFDAPNREQGCTRRERSNTPLQALQLLNDIQHFEAARGLATRMLTEGGRTPAERITFAYRTLLSRPPTPDELAVVTAALERHRARYAADPASARKAVTFGESRAPQDLPEAELAAYTLAANLLLNLDETVTRN